MPVLKHAKHERFAQELANGVPGTGAYILAGYKKDSGNAARLQQDDRIIQRVSEILSEREAIHAQATAIAIEKTALTKEWVIEKLRKNALIALGEEKLKASVFVKSAGEVKEIEITARDAGAANRALELLGKEMGMFIDRHEIGGPGDFDHMSDEELNQLIVDGLKENPDLMKRIREGGVSKPDVVSMKQKRRMH